MYNTTMSKHNIIKNVIAFLIGSSGFMIYFAFDDVFNMSVISPIILVVAILVMISNGGKIEVSPLLVASAVLILLFAIPLLINVFWYPELVTAISFVRMVYVIVILVYICSIQAARLSRKNIRVVFNLNIIVGLFISTLIIKNWLSGAQGKISVISFLGRSVEENYTGSLLTSTIILSLFLLTVYSGKLSKLLIILSMIPMTFAMSLTGCRAAAIALGAGVGVIVVTLIFSSSINIFTRVVILAAIIGTVFLIATNAQRILPSFIYNRFFVSGLNDYSNNTRLEIWKFGLKGFLKRPIFGFGVGNYNYYVMPIFHMPSVVAHNTYLDFLVDTGIVGFILYMIILVKSIFPKKIDNRFIKILPLLMAIAITSAIVGADRTFFFWNTVVILMLIVRYLENKPTVSIKKEIFKC